MRFGLLILVLFAILLLFMGAAEQGDYFLMYDSVGDDNGYGAYQYPTNIAFQPYQGLFDILQFRVAAGPERTILFDTTFRNMSNPWAAPEGFIHQNLRIFIDSIPGRGSTVLPEKGASIRFNPKFAWDICLRITGWGNSQIITIEDGVLKTKPLKAGLLKDGHTIRALVPETELGKPARNWHYYVLVGSYDGFGEDFFRKVDPKPGEWVIGGGTGRNIDPRIMDLLAPEKGPHSQEKQLYSFDPETGQLAEIYPVGRDLKESNLRVWILGTLFILLLAAMIYMLRHKIVNISWFWVKGPKNEISG